MCKNFQFFQTMEMQISDAINKGDNLRAAELINQYVHDRLGSFAHRQGRFYRELLDETGSDPKSAAQQSRKTGKSISQSTAAKLAKRQAMPSFSSLAKLVSERNREVVLILEPFEGTQKRKHSIRFSAQESASYATSKLLCRMLQQGAMDKPTLSQLSGISETTIRQAEKHQGHPLYDESIVCHNVETFCRLAAANEYRVSLLFCRSTAHEDRMS